MTRVRIEDLPPELRRQLEAGFAGEPTGGGTGRAARRRASSPGPAYRCVGCNVTFRSYGRWETHSDQSGHRRGEMVL